MSIFSLDQAHLNIGHVYIGINLKKSEGSQGTCSNLKKSEGYTSRLVSSTNHA
jgi:hypothetical protein